MQSVRPSGTGPCLLAVLALPAGAFAAGVPGEPGIGADAGPADVLALVAYVTLALLFSFLCSISEAVLLSLSPSFVENLMSDRPRLARRMQALARQRWAR